MIQLEAILAEDERLLGCSASDIIRQLPNRLSHGVLRWSSESPDQIAVTADTGQLTYAELAEAVTESKQLLTNKGVRAGDRVMLVCENGISLICLFLALSELDAIAVVINARLSDREIDLIGEDCDPRLKIYTVDDSPDARKHAKREDAQALSLSFAGLMLGSVLDVEPEQVFTDPVDQVLAMIYTTGTTGTPKGVMLTQRNLTFIAFVSGRLRGVEPRDNIYCVLPMSHVFGLSAVCCSVLFSGGCIHLVSRFSAQETLRALQQDGIAGFLGVPTMYALMLESFPEDWHAPKLKFMYSGGAPLDPDIKKRVEAAFGLQLNNGYGLTETGPTVCQTRRSKPLQNCSVGYQLPAVEIKLLSDAGAVVEQGTVGELWVKGPNIMKGYFRKPEETREVIKDGWFNTGDLVYQDETGAINIAGRSKELIIRSGFNIYPPEVEAVLTAHPQVSLCAVIGEAVEGNENILAFIQPVAGEVLDEADLMAFAKQNLAGYKLPTRLIVMETLPAAASGKILKHQLKGL